MAEINKKSLNWPIVHEGLTSDDLALIVKSVKSMEANV